MSTLENRLNDATLAIEDAANKMNAIIQGGPSAPDVVLSSGVSVPPIRKWYTQNFATLTTALNSNVAQSEAARDAAQTARNQAQTARTESQAARDKSKQWADNDSGVLVPGEGAGKYSAKHWASAAQTSESNASSHATTARNWAQTPYNTNVPGQGTGSRSALHYSVVSQNHSNMAQKWASEAENVVVSGGLYSSRHYALKALESANIASSVVSTIQGGIAFSGSWNSSLGNFPPVPVSGGSLYYIGTGGTLSSGGPSGQPNIVTRTGDFLTWHTDTNRWLLIRDGTNVNKSDVGLGSVPNWGASSEAQALAGTANNVFMTPLRATQAFNQYGLGTVPVTITDWNTVPTGQTQFYQGNNAANGPGTGWFNGYYVKHSANYGVLKLTQFTGHSSGNAIIAERVYFNGTWQPWQTVHHSGNQITLGTTQLSAREAIGAHNASNLTTGTIPAARVPTLNQNTTGNAATATRLQTARTIGGVSFNGTANIDLPGVNVAGNQNTSGNATTATRLQTARTINGVSFNGTENITIVDSTKEPIISGGNTSQFWRGDKTWVDFQSTVRSSTLAGFSVGSNSAIAADDNILDAFGKVQAQINSKLNSNANAVSATRLQTARTIGGVSFNGTANIDLPGVNVAGNQNTSGNAASASKLQTARTITLSGGVTGSTSFDGSGHVTINTTVVPGNHTHSNLAEKDTQPRFTGLTIGTNNNVQMWNDSTGNGLYVRTGSSGNLKQYFFSPNGDFLVEGDIGGFSSSMSSDERFKEDWKYFDEGYIERLANVKAGVYTRIDRKDRPKQAGVSAQDLRKLSDNFVLENEDGYLSVHYASAALVSSVELAKELVKVKKELEELKKSVKL